MYNWILTYAPILALCISVLALITSALSLGWNIYRDVVMKPKLRISFGVKHITETSGKQGSLQIILSATNYGPGQITCQMTTLKKSSLVRHVLGRVEHSIVIQDYTNPICSKLPSRLNMAESTTLIFAYNKECFLQTRPTHIGISDSFGRIHWAPRASVREAIRKYEIDFQTPSKHS